MTGWQKLLQRSITGADQLDGLPGADPAEIAEVARVYPMRINPYYFELLCKTGAPLWRQAVPDARELNDTVGMTDPLDEENLSPVPNLVSFVIDPSNLESFLFGRSSPFPGPLLFTIKSGRLIIR